MTTCIKCGATWGGMSTCHCDGCHHTFTSPSAFDLHRRAEQCRTPAQAGLVLTDRAYPCFGHPQSDTERPTSWANNGQGLIA
ncbi:FDXHR family putative zinc-binding protein [Rhodococcus sp. YH3-3]|uniref:FDXHR family putative zinc-binding protein n=1 Tax=Rhodococcus qingshengii TaxID=334542 RepID=UPI0009EDBC87